MLKKKENNIKKVIYILAIAMFLVMAVIAIVVNVLIDVSQRQKKVADTQTVLTSPIDNALTQDAWKKQSELKKLLSYKNGSSEASTSVLWEYNGNIYVNFEFIKSKYNLKPTLSQSDDVQGFILNSKQVYIRLGSSRLLYDGGLRVFSSAPIEFDGELFVPSSMVEYLEQQMNCNFSWAVFDQKVFLNSMLSKNSIDLMKITNDSSSFTVRDVFQEGMVAKFDTGTDAITKIKTVILGERKLFFVKTTMDTKLTELKQNVIESIQTFPQTAQISVDGEIIFWQDNSNLQAFNIKSGKTYSLNKENFANGFFESVFGVGNFTVIRVQYNNSKNFSVDFVTSNGSQTCVRKDKDGIKLFSDVINSSDGKYFVKKTDGYYEVFDKKTGMRKATFYSSVKPIWLSNNMISFKNANKYEVIFMSSGLQKDIDSNNQIATKIYKDNYNTNVTSDYLVLTQESSSGTSVEISKNSTLQNALKSFYLQLDTSSQGFTVTQKGKDILVFCDSKMCWVINTASNEVYCNRLEAIEVGFIF